VSDRRTFPRPAEHERLRFTDSGGLLVARPAAGRPAEEVLGPAARVHDADGAEAYLGRLHRLMAEGGAFGASRQSMFFALGVIQGFAAAGLLTAREASRAWDRLHEYPDRGQHCGSASWCNFCAELCRGCGRAQAECDCGPEEKECQPSP
jgi:hypothetical protein